MSYTARSMSSRWVYLSIMPDSTIRKKPGVVPRQHRRARPQTCSVKSGCSGNFFTVAAFEELAVERAVHVAEREQPSSLSSSERLARDGHLGRRWSRPRSQPRGTCATKSASSARCRPPSSAGSAPCRRPSARRAWRQRAARRSRSYAARRRVCATIAAGVASSISVLVTMPTAMPSRRLHEAGDGLDPRIVERSLACGRHRPPIALTAALWPVA